MELSVYNQQAQSSGSVTVSDDVFSAPLNKDLIYQVVTAQMANQRKTLAHAKGRSEVRGGGRKPWRQKGTGRARHGSIRSPIWKGGGVTFGPTKEKDYSRKINVTMARKALFATLSEKIRNGMLAVVDDIVLEQPKTKNAAQTMKAVRSLFKDAKPHSHILIVVPSAQGSEALRRALRNIPTIDAVPASDLNALTVLSHPFLVVPKNALDVIQKRVGHS